MLRAATLRDAGEVAGVMIESRRAFVAFAPMAHAEDDVRRWVRERLVPGGGVWVWGPPAQGDRAAQVVAMLACSQADGVAWIDHLYLRPGWTGQGIGERLRLLAHALAVLPRPLRLYTFQANAGARRFYERHGFRALALTDGQGNEERCPDVLYELGGAGPADPCAA